MVDRQLRGRGIADERVLAAMAAVPRELFVPPGLIDRAYADGPLPIENGQTISQPYIVALMAEAAGIGPGDTVLEIGTGSGYAAAVVSRLAARVFTVERHAAMGETARHRLAELGFSNVEVRIGDGMLGWSEQAPFDAVLAAACGESVPPAWKEQLAPGGRIIVPLGRDEADQELVRLRKDERGRLVGESLGGVRFVPLLPGTAV